ncbi:amidohydrolase family protein [Agromyces mediolanus]|uniref:amidohydrolase family protein n=1 Tax=Agromyces mediolanus TaxID=41986 RepID=UPI0020401237|nr:amidohydrolase family protein [Agromyces mediolanus]MCM3659136.1 amidohydrolase family protein [Agromyces mediolanus]
MAPSAPALLVAGAALHGRPGTHDVLLRDGAVAAIEASGSIGAVALAEWADRAGAERLDARGGLLARAFVEPHLHPDKSFSLSELDPAEASGLDHFARSSRIKAGFTPERVARRARRAFELAVANGVTRLRANIDIDFIAGLRGFEGVLQAREEVRGILDVDLVAFPQEGLGRDPGALPLLREALRSGADLVGGWPNVEEGDAEQRAHVRTVFELAEEFDVDVDIHADCWLDERERMLEVVADETIARGYQGRVLASHCCGIERYSEEDARRVAARIAEADVRVAIIPLNLVDGGPRGLSRPHELRRAGAELVVGSDNLNDGWYPLGTLSPLDRAYMTLVGGGYGDDDVDLVWHMVAAGAAHALDDRGRADAEAWRGPDVTAGMPADLVLLGARDRLEALRRPGGPLTTIKAGRIVARRSVDEAIAGAGADARLAAGAGA